MEKKLSPHAAAAQAIRSELKKLGVKAKVTSERFSMGNAVTVYLEDINPAMMEAIKEITSKYQFGTFRAMEDYYDMNNVIHDIPQVKYVHVSNRPSAAMKDKISQALMATKYPGFDTAQPWEVSELVHNYFRNEQFWKEHLAA
ncbi:hypothetical protein [Nitrosomonas ureae]|uniref:Large polyvalent protein associated domain-containing protein n=1 Tax=Nitrosomonas ureae TaxID=44577 RepID=A0A1H2ENR3_9PROT|nr:hypothetical protein [Nitrosomonas ureae]ALQ51907.1 hypothetical protein ATY38_12165 [Nitrosomonas ureae]SDT96750.1 hypothetical protein SAMN05216406_11436 [Nitrosomonas ureae]